MFHPIPKTLEYITNKDKTFHIAEGPIRAGKTSDNIVMIADFIEESPDSVHLSIGQTQSVQKQLYGSMKD